LNISIPATQAKSAQAVAEYQQLVQEQWADFQREADTQENSRIHFLDNPQQKLMQCSDALLVDNFKEFCRKKGLL
jgi:hypothetical protein